MRAPRVWRRHFRHFLIRFWWTRPVPARGCSARSRRLCASIRRRWWPNARRWARPFWTTRPQRCGPAACCVIPPVPSRPRKTRPRWALFWRGIRSSRCCPRRRTRARPGRRPDAARTPSRQSIPGAFTPATAVRAISWRCCKSAGTAHRRRRSRPGRARPAASAAQSAAETCAPAARHRAETAFPRRRQEPRARLFCASISPAPHSFRWSAAEPSCSCSPGKDAARRKACAWCRRAYARAARHGDVLCRRITCLWHTARNAPMPNA